MSITTQVKKRFVVEIVRGEYPEAREFPTAEEAEAFVADEGFVSLAADLSQALNEGVYVEELWSDDAGAGLRAYAMVSYDGPGFAAMPEFRRNGRTFWTASPESEPISGTFALVEREGDTLLLRECGGKRRHWQVPDEEMGG